MLDDFKKKFAFLKSNCGKEKSRFEMDGKEGRINNLSIKELKDGFCNISSY